MKFHVKQLTLFVLAMSGATGLRRIQDGLHRMKSDSFA
jgi:hypothetical protein